MRFSIVVVVASVFLASGCLGATAKERKANGTTAVVVGAAALGVGALLTHHEEGECRDGPGYAPGSCFEQDLIGGVLGLTGIVTMSVGVGNLIAGFAESNAPPEGQVELVASHEADQTACAQWLSAYERERDPNRRASLRAAAPAHCASLLRAAR